MRISDWSSDVCSSDLLAAKLGRLVQTQASDRGAPTPTSFPLPRGDDFDIVAIGASTGGIHALSRLLRAIPPDFALPVLITQHLPDSFMPYFAAQIALLAGRPCAEIGSASCRDRVCLSV